VLFEIRPEFARDGFLLAFGILDLFDPADVLLGHVPDIRIVRLGQFFQALQMALGFLQCCLVVILVVCVMVDGLDRRKNIVSEQIIGKRITNLGRGRVDPSLAKHVYDLLFGLRPNLHLDNGLLLALHGLNEDERVLVLDILLIKTKSFSLPTEFANVFNKVFVARTQAGFLGSFQGNVLETESFLAQHVRVEALEVAAEVAFAIKRRLVKSLLAGLILTEAPLDVWAQHIQVVVIRYLLDLADVL